MRLAHKQWVMGALFASLGLSACGVEPSAGTTVPTQWQSVSIGSLTVTRSATGIVTLPAPAPVSYEGSTALVARSLTHPGTRVAKGTPLLLLSNGLTVKAPAAGVVTQVAPVGASVGGSSSATTVATVRPNTPPTVLVSVPAADVSDWSVGTSVTGGPAGQGSIRGLTSAGGGAYQASVVFARDNRLKAGSEVVVTSAVEHLSHVYRVPAGAIISGPHGGYAVRTKSNQRVPIKILGVAPMTVAVQGNLHNHEAVWVPPVAGTQALTQSSSFLP